MPGFGNRGQRVALAPSGFGKKNISPPKTTYENYVPPVDKAPTGINTQMDYLKGIPTGYTPEQELAMRNRVRSTDTAQQAGGINRMSELMAARGLAGSGAESSGISGLIRGQNAARQGALSNIDLSNAQLGLQNQYAKAGMLNQLTGMGENARQFNYGQDSNMYQFGKGFDENQRQYNQQRSDYQRQLDEWLSQLQRG